MNNYLDNLLNKNILVVGLAKSGIAVLEELSSYNINLFIQDIKSKNDIGTEILSFLEEKNIKYFLGKIPDDISSFDLIILSPGVNENLDFLTKARDQGVEVIGELELAYRLASGNWIAITGTNGKTTTTSLVGEIFDKSNERAFVCGNIGIPAIKYSIKSEKSDFIVSEVSSFQLDTISEFKPKVAAILNITPDHLDRYNSMENYRMSKAQIFKNQDAEDFLILNYDQRELLELGEDSKARVVPLSMKFELDFGVYYKDNSIYLSDDNQKNQFFIARKDINLLGNHNIENVMAAIGISYFSGIDKRYILEGIRGFKPVEHRMEIVDTIDGVIFINDSKGTNPEASIKAVEAIDDNIILICGGYDKKSDFKDFIKSFNNKVKKLYLIGETAKLIEAQALELEFSDIEILDSLKECVEASYEFAREGDSVLLSPACASWDMYTSYEKRGQDFKNCVLALKGV